MSIPPLMVLPEPPATLNADGAALWREIGGELVACGVLRTLDVWAFEQLCYAWQRFRAAAKADMPIPGAKINSLKGLFAEFGLSPATRRRILAQMTRPQPKNRFAGHGRRPQGDETP
jgi:phage terminase small subunit